MLGPVKRSGDINELPPKRGAAWSRITNWKLVPTSKSTQPRLMPQDRSAVPDLKRPNYAKLRQLSPQSGVRFRERLGRGCGFDSNDRDRKTHSRATYRRKLSD